MKHLSASIKIGVMVVVVVVGGYYAWKAVDESGAGKGGYSVYARFRDASGLPPKSRVVIAGLSIGEITGRRLDGRLALLTVKLSRGAELYTNAGIYKKSSSLLGEYYLEIDPGTSESVGPDGKIVKNARMKDGDEFQSVFEAATADELMRRVTDVMPHVDAVLVEVRGLAAEARALVKGPVREMADQLNAAVKVDAKLVNDILERADRAMAYAEQITRDVAGITDGAEGQVDRILGNVELASKDLAVLAQDARREITSLGVDVRGKLDKLDRSLALLEETLDSTASVTRKIDEDQGTLGRLVNDPQIADDVQTITSAAAGFVQTAFGLQTIVGISSEYNFFAEAMKTYVSVELVPRPDKFYLVELVADPRGSISSTYVLEADGSLRRETLIEDSFRFSFMFARRVGRYTFRIGLKESTGGVGADADFFDNRLRVSADFFDASFDHYPRIKLAAAVQFFRWIYIYGGVDDLANPREEIAIGDPTVTGNTDTYSYGRDVFGGVMLKFTDADLSALLFMGGSALGALGGK